MSFSEGALLKGSGPEVFVIESRRRRWVTSGDDFERLGGPAATSTVDDSSLRAIPLGPPMGSPTDGTLFKASGPEIYVVRDGRRCWVPDEATLDTVGGMAGVLAIMDESLNSLPAGAPLISVIQPPPALKAQLVRNPPDRQEKEDSPRPDPVEGKPDYVCTVCTKSVTDATPESIQLDPLSDVVWPGAIIDASSVATGAYRLVREDRMPITLSISTSEPGLADIQVNDPSLASVRNAIAELFSRAAQKPSVANIAYRMSEAHSEAETMLSLGISLNSGIHEFSADVNYKSRTERNRAVVAFTQSYFSIDAELTDPEAGPYKSGRPTMEDDVMVSSVGYGRLLLFSLESDVSSKDLQAAVEYAWKGFGSGNVKVEAYYKKIISNSNVKLRVIGGSAVDSVRIHSLDDAREYIIKGGNFSNNSPAAPISYKLRFLRDNSVANVLLSTTYQERKCFRTTGKFRLKDLALACVQTDDESGGTNEKEEEEFYGWLKVDVYDGVNRSPVQSIPLWSLTDRKQHLNMRRQTKLRIGHDEIIQLDDFSSVMDSAYLQFTGELYDHDNSGGDDLVGRIDRRIFINDLKSEPDQVEPSNMGDKTDQMEPVGVYRMRLQNSGTQATMSFTIQPL